MSGTPTHAEHSAASVEDERWALVQRIASSRHFLKAPQLREILLYLARRALTDNATVISEQEIGCKVLGRRPDFSTNEDNIVRVQVRHLRRKLEEYFSSDGVEEPIVVTIPKGAYLPRFETHISQPVRQAVGVVPPCSEGPASVETGRAPARVAGARWAVILLTALLVALSLTTLILWRQRRTLRQTVAADEGQARRGDPLWSRIFVPGQGTEIVVSDSSLVAVQDVLNVDIALNDYLSGAYPEKLIEIVPDKQLRTALRLIAARQYTSLSDANIASRMMELSRRYPAQTTICYSRFVSVREFKTGNLILIGSRRGIPWEQMFEPELNFSLEEDRATGKYFFLNKAPMPKEQASYRPSSGRDADTYADIALLPNLAGTGYVLILAGIDMAATEAAGELVASPDFPDLLNRMLRSRSGQPPASYIEILMRAQTPAGTVQTSRIVGYRLLAGKLPRAPEPGQPGVADLR